MEIEQALRNADNKVIVVLALIFGALVFLIGVASNDVPSEIPMVQSSFDIAPPVVALPAPSEKAEAKPQVALQVAHVAAVKTAASKKDYTWYADEAASGARPDSQH